MEKKLLNQWSVRSDKKLLAKPVVPSKESLGPLFPKTAEDLSTIYAAAIAEAKDSLQAIYEIPACARNFDNSIMAFDLAHASFRIPFSIISITSMVHPEKEMRDLASELEEELSKFSVDTFEANLEFYKAYKEYIQENSHPLPEQEQYYLDELEKSFRRSGFELTGEGFTQSLELRKELSSLCIRFDKNINEDKGFVLATKDELDGLEEEFISSLKLKDEQYVLKLDYPSYFLVQDDCRVEKTRRRLFLAFNQRAYPENKELLFAIAEKRRELATLLGYESYADLDLESEMVKTPKAALSFIEELIAPLQKKAALEHENLKSCLPDSVTLEDGKIKPWDFRFLTNHYSKKELRVDESEIENYFPLDETIEGLFDIYERFLGIGLKSVEASNFWHDSVALIEISKENQILGHVALDLFPREGKYSHACCCDIVAPFSRSESSVDPAFALLICNFPQAKADKPALMRFDDVETFFHEFGHALHFVLGRAKMPSLAGFNTKLDFVEMPSQILEEWLCEPKILKMLSSHYQTKAALPDDLIERKIKAQDAFTGHGKLKQLSQAVFALKLYGKQSLSSLKNLQDDIRKTYLPQVATDSDDHFYASFGHLSSYSARYYSYMWAKVFALDVFKHIKDRKGLLDSSVGGDYIRHIIGRGGSVDPNILLRDFLGRDANNEAFIEKLGI